MSELKNPICCPYFGSEFREKTSEKSRETWFFRFTQKSYCFTRFFTRFSLNSDPKLDSKSDFSPPTKKPTAFLKLGPIK